MSFIEVLQPWIPILVLSMSIVTLILFIIIIIQGIKLKKIRKKYQSFMNGVEGINFEELLEIHTEKLNHTQIQMKEIEQHINRLDTQLKGCVQKVGMVRYSAFEDIGSDLSFALALLDEKDNGIIINGIFARNNSYIYAKPIQNGQSTYKLSEEETEALQRAKTEFQKLNISLNEQGQ